MAYNISAVGGLFAGNEPSVGEDYMASVLHPASNKICPQSLPLPHADQPTPSLARDTHYSLSSFTKSSLNICVFNQSNLWKIVTPAKPLTHQQVISKRAPFVDFTSHAPDFMYL